jgi:hypothetical protein
MENIKRNKTKGEGSEVVEKMGGGGKCWLSHQVGCCGEDQVALISAEAKSGQRTSSVFFLKKAGVENQLKEWKILREIKQKEKEVKLSRRWGEALIL